MISGKVICCSWHKNRRKGSFLNGNGGANINVPKDKSVSTLSVTYNTILVSTEQGAIHEMMLSQRFE